MAPVRIILLIGLTVRIILLIGLTARIILLIGLTVVKNYVDALTGKEL